MLYQNRLLANLKRFSTSANLRISNETVQNRGDYYKNLGHVDQEVKPAGWDSAVPFEQIPGPKPVPFFGNMLKFVPKIGELNVPQQELYPILKAQYGDVIKLDKVWGRNPMVFLNNPDDIEKAFRNEGAWPCRPGLESMVHYRRDVRDDVFQGVGGVMTVHGEDWFNVRSQVNPILMQPKNANLYVQSMNDVTDDFVQNIRHFATLNKDHEMPENFQTEIYKWSMESIGVIALDERLGVLNLNLDKNHKSYNYISHILEMFNLMYYLDVLPSLYKFYSTRNWRKFVKTMDYITYFNLERLEKAIKKLEASKDDAKLSVLQQLLKKDKKIALTMVMDMMMAGIDTTGRVLGAALYFMASNPDKQQLLREELLHHLPDKNTPITKEILQNSPYLRAAVKETVRISPIAIGNLRRAVKDLVIGGYQIPKDTDIIGLGIINTQSDEYYKEAKKFIPERWLRSTEGEYSHKNTHPFVYLPFGFGPRSCIGKRLANLELEMGIAKIIRNFKLTWPHPEAEFNSTLLYGIVSPLKFHVHPVDN